LTGAEWNLYKEIYDLSSALLRQYSHKVIYLDYSHKTLKHRIEKRGRDYELSHYTPEFILQLEKGISDLKINLEKNEIPILTITERVSPDFENNPNQLQKIMEKVKLLL
jgi:deoxyadenosine/deoxycytidine kinase